MFSKTTSILTSALLLAVSVQANAATVVDTGTPANLGFPLALDGSDWLAGQFQLSVASTITDVSSYLAGATNGDTFTFSLYQDSINHVGTLVSSVGATFGSDGWNGVSNLNWNVGAGKYWLALEVQGSDSMAFGTAPVDAPTPMVKTAFNDGSGYHVTTSPLTFGVKIDAIPVSVVPEPEAYAMMLTGLGVVGFAARRRKQFS